MSYVCCLTQPVQEKPTDTVFLLWRDVRRLSVRVKLINIYLTYVNMHQNIFIILQFVITLNLTEKNGRNFHSVILPAVFQSKIQFCRHVQHTQSRFSLSIDHTMHVKLTHCCKTVHGFHIRQPASFCTCSRILMRN